MIKKKESTSGRIKDYLKGIICLGGGIILVILGFVWISILPLAIVLWVIGFPWAFTGLGLIIHNKKNNTHYYNTDSSSSSSSTSQVKRYGKPKNPNEDNDEPKELSTSYVENAIVGMSNGYVNVAYANVNRDSANRFSINLELEKLVGWEGPYSDSAYNEGARSMKNDVEKKVNELGGSANVKYTWRWLFNLYIKWSSSCILQDVLFYSCHYG